MELFLKFDISFFSVLLLIMVYAVMRLRKDTISPSSKLFRGLIWTTIYMLILEIISWQFDEKPGSFNYYANYITNMLFAWSTPLLTCIWASYIDYHIFGSVERLKRRFYYMHPMILNTIFIIINFFTPFIFSVSIDNVYSREKFMWLIVIQNGLLLIYLWGLAFKNRQRINKEVTFSILIFVILPAFTAVLQVISYGIFILWPTMAITIVITYIFLETVSTSKDYLTGLLSRYRLDNYIEIKLKEKRAFGLIMIDLDGFKKINDNYGHISGDRALKIFAKALMKSSDKHSIAGRYAGDEFLIVTKILDENELEDYRLEIHRNLDELIKKHKIDFKIDFSIGYSQWCKRDNYDYELLVNIADSNMYENKKSKR